MFVAPPPTALARPVDAPIVATLGVPEDHVEPAVRSCVEPSLFIPVAVNCCVPGMPIEGFAGVTAMETKVTGAFTVNVCVGLVRPLYIAVIREVPTPALVAKPVLASIVATDSVADAHVAVVVMFCVLPSVNTPIAANCCVEG
jgi:hypothetical protein